MRLPNLSHRLLVAAPLLLALSADPARSEPVSVTLADNGVAHFPVVVATGATDRVRAAADDLAGLLQRITGAPFAVQVATNATRGIQVGAAGDFTNLPPDFVFAPDHPLRREEYRIRTHAHGVWIVGATEQAAIHAVWGLLDGLGYRLFFLTDTWEVVPEIPALRLALDTLDAPDYHTRQAPRGAPWSDRKLWQRWCTRNRINSAFSLSTGHAYDGIIRANREVFGQNPGFYPLINGERRHAGRTDGGGNIKFCIGNAELRRVVVDYAVRSMQANPARESISMDPSDGSGWCECDACAAIGSPSDRVLLLANEVAEAINALGLGPKYVGIYAYNQHSPPPSIRAHSNVVVSVATSFIRGGYTVEQLIEGWRAQGATLGIRDYHDVFTWSHDMPRRARGGNLDYLQRTIPYFHSQGARFMNSENSDSWGANGLGYWISPRLLWRVSEAERIDALIDDFTTRAFGPAAEPMRAFYALLNQDHSLHTAEHVVARMYRDLAAARERAAARPDVLARLDDLVLYTRYCELYHAYRQASGEARQAGFEAIWRHAYRMRDRWMLSTVAICNRERYRDRAMVMPEEAAWSVPEEKNPWKDSTPFAVAEINGLLQAGIASNQLVVLDFEPVAFGERLVPATGLPIPENLQPGELPLTGRGLRKFLLWFEQPRDLSLDVTGGLIAGYRDRGNVKIRLFAEQEATLEAVAVDESVPPDGETRTVTLKSPYAGLHTLEVSDGSDRTSLTIPDELPLTVPSSQEERARLGGRWTLYCYVPRGTTVVGGYAADNTGQLRDSAGQIVFDFTRQRAAGYFSVPVAPGQDGAFWRFEQCAGDRYLMTIPPYLAAHPAKLLLPAEVVARDAKPPAPAQQPVAQ
jgi:hypothetical protein